jgi:cation diffusion facilitator CzcD-associated flavoprotein CzcO
VKKDLEWLIVGAGFSGLGMAIALLREGERNFVVLEKADAIGGTWRDNTYPGCACDVPSHLYSFSFEQNPRWSRLFAPQQEIWDYMERCADKYGVRPHLRFNQDVIRCEWDERRSVWRVQTKSGDSYTARFLVFGTGPLSQPSFPEIRGQERFRGRAFHSQRWDHNYELNGKRVAVIGTGASAIQFVPQIQPKVQRLHLFQRTPPWIMPKPDVAIAPSLQKVFAAVPATQRALRNTLWTLMDLRGFGFSVAPGILRWTEQQCIAHIKKQVPDPELQQRLIPDYRAGCKRILIADDYYPAVAKPNVELVTDGITEIREHSIVTTTGEEREIDALIYGTGFRVTDFLSPMAVLGRGGRDLNDAWRNGIEGYMGAMVSGYPNFFMLLGPNSGLGHNSMIFMIEAQVHYALQIAKGLAARGARSFDVRPREQQTYNARVQERLSQTVWASGCHSWYLDKNGKNTTVWPGITAEYWLRTRRPNFRHLELDPQPLPTVHARGETAPL